MANLVTKIIISARDEASSVFEKLKANAGKVAAGIAAFFGTKALAGAINSSIEAANKLDQQMRVLEQTVEATGGAAGLTAEELDDMARRLDEATLGSAEGFRDAAAKLLTFKSVGKDSFETVLMLAADLEATGFGNLQTNIVQLGKAMEDPVKGMTALAKSGVTFTDAQVEVIKKLVETGKAAEAQGIILEAVKGQVEGVASAAGGGMAGALDLVGKRLTDMKEQLGKAVLPVLNDFYMKIAEVYKRLSDSGVVKKFGEVLASVFKSATDTFVRFFESFDIDAVIAKLSGWASSTKQTMDEIAGYLSTASTSFKLLFASINTGIDAIKTAFFGVAGVVAQWASSVTGAYATVLEQMAKVSDRFASSATETRAIAEAFAASAKANFGKAAAALEDTAESGKAVVSSFKDLVGAEEDAAAAAAKVAASTDQAAEHLATLAAQNALASKSFSDLGISSQQVAAKLAEISAQTGVTVKSTRELQNAVADGSIAFNEATGAWGKGVVGLNGLTVAGENAGQALIAFKSQTLAAAKDSKSLSDQSGDTAEKIRALTEQYKAFIAAGDTQAAAAIQEQIRALRALSTQAGVTAEDVEAAFERLGVKSTAVLKQAADAAKRDFDLIKASGTASAADIEAAFKSYAEKAIEANAGVATEALKAQAAQNGMKIEADEAGKVIVRSMKEAKEATEEIADAANDAADGMGELGEAGEGAADSASGLASSMTQAGAATRSAGTIIGKVSQEQISAYRDLDYARKKHVLGMIADHNARINAAEAEGEALERIARQQDRLSSSAARGVDDLKLRLIELNGTEDEIAKARRDRDKADVARQIALIELDIKRASVRGENADTLKEEIKLLKEQLGLIDQVFAAEKRNSKSKGSGDKDRRDPDRKRNTDSDADSASAGNTSSAGNAPAANTNLLPVKPLRTVNVNLNIGGKTIPVSAAESDATRLIRELETLERVSA